MRLAPSSRALLAASMLSLAGLASGCDDPKSEESNITDVPHTDVERQSIGNCWLYATASWVESMHLSATGESFDTSQSYWTYWHWYDQIVDEGVSEIETGGSEWISFEIIRDRGIVTEAEFIQEDTVGEMSNRQAAALSKINEELKTGRLESFDSRSDRKLVRQVLDEAWGLTEDVRASLDSAFGEDGSATFQDDARAEGTPILPADQFVVRYTERETDPDEPTIRDTSLAVAVDEWRTVSYPFSASSRRNFQIRVQKALHDRQPVIITWDVDFNAMEGQPGEMQGSFNLDTLERAGGPGRQGGHMTVLEDYEATTQEFGVLEAGVTLDPKNADDAAKLEAALLPSTTVKFWRIKNSWGALRDDRASAPGFPGYHDLYQTYLDGPIDWCPSVEGEKTEDNCHGETTPWANVILAPGY